MQRGRWLLSLKSCRVWEMMMKIIRFSYRDGSTEADRSYSTCTLKPCGVFRIAQRGRSFFSEVLQMILCSCE